MRTRKTWIAALAGTMAMVGVAPAALAQGAAPPKRAQAATVVVSTSDYTESQLGGDQVVTFPGDELPATGPSAYGDVVRRPPGVMRSGLIRPRLNFVSELVKSVENL